ncbi:hypothetical protein [Alicyclobacillus fodiniaquatilis]|uniref:Uncharacterized protein n=1 Tax=Alicyclobacillus fodiniaquatilis TaxID=1661150 RepID=A0ABW4JJI8_9BACL
MSVQEPQVRSTNDIKFIMKLMSTNQKKKFQLIQSFIRKNFRDVDGFDELSELEVDLHKLTDDALADLYEFMDQTYSQGQPYFIYEFCLKDNVTQQNLKEKIETGLPQNKSLSVDNKYPRVEITRISEVEYHENHCLRFSITYEQFVETPRRQSDTGEESKAKTSLDVIFDFQSSLLYFTCGENKYALATKRVIMHYLLDTFSHFSAFSMTSSVKKTKFEGDFSNLSKQSIVTLDYLDSSVEKNNYEITNYLRIAFSNVTSEKVKGVRLSGSNLFESIEMAERIRFGDTIKSVKFTLRHHRVTTSQNLTGSGTSSAVRMDFTNSLKILFSDDENVALHIDFVRHLMATLKESLQKIYTETDVKTKIQPLIERAEAKDNLIVQGILSRLKEKITTLYNGDPAGNSVISLLNEYIG